MLIDNLTMTINGPIMKHTQILVHRWGPEQDFQRCSAEGLKKGIVLSVAQAKSHVMKEFERRTSTGSGLFALLSSDIEHIFGQIVFIRAKTLSNTNH